MSGTVSADSIASQLTGCRAPFSATHPETTFAGRYTMLLSGGTNGEASPIREGFAALIVAPNGRVRLAAALADNTPSAQTRFLSAGGNIPFYTSLYRGGGSCFGWLTLLETPASDVHGQLRWTNPAGMPGPFHPSGFREKLILIGSRNSATNPPAPGRGAP